MFNNLQPISNLINGIYEFPCLSFTKWFKLIMRVLDSLTVVLLTKCWNSLASKTLTCSILAIWCLPLKLKNKASVEY